MNIIFLDVKLYIFVIVFGLIILNFLENVCLVNSMFCFYIWCWYIGDVFKISNCDVIDR